MSRKRNANYVRTKDKQVKVGELVTRNGEPQLLVGPNDKKDYFTLQDMTVACYGPGAEYHVTLPESRN
jgi:hypothetical protein